MIPHEARSAIIAIGPSLTTVLTSLHCKGSYLKLHISPLKCWDMAMVQPETIPRSLIDIQIPTHPPGNGSSISHLNREVLENHIDSKVAALGERYVLFPRRVYWVYWLLGVFFVGKYVFLEQTKKYFFTRVFGCLTMNSKRQGLWTKKT